METFETTTGGEQVSLASMLTAAAHLLPATNTTDVAEWGNATSTLAPTELAERLTLLETRDQELGRSLDQLFLVIMGSIVFLMQPGFAFLEAGAVRSKNVTSVLIRNYSELCFGAFAFLAFGYGFAYGQGSPFIGLTHFGLADLPRAHYGHVVLQASFSCTAASIVSGSITERFHYVGYVIFSVVMSGLVYPIAAHWGWADEGWLKKTEFHDFAGSGLIHLLGGVQAIIGPLMLGPRSGRFGSNKNNHAGEKAVPLSGHSLPLTTLGSFILIFGFLAFNGGSTGGISQPGNGDTLATAVVNTIISCCVAGFTVLIIHRLLPGGSWSLVQLVNGSLSGMVAICAGCDRYYPWAAAVVAAIAGAAYVLVSWLVVRAKIDDPLDAIGVHCSSGFTGLILCPIFAQQGILLTRSRNAYLGLAWNLAAAASVIAWSAACGAITFSVLKALRLFRVAEASEEKGLDLSEFNEPAYPIEAYVIGEGSKKEPEQFAAAMSTAAWKRYPVPQREAWLSTQTGNDVIGNFLSRHLKRFRRTDSEVRLSPRGSLPEYLP